LASGDCGDSGLTPLSCSEEIDLMSESFSAFREQYLRRHENPVNSALHTVADVVAVGGLAAGVITRRIRVVVIGDTVAFAIATVGHLFFQPGTLRDDLAADFRHPIWYVRAEGQRIFARPT
jgi:hypothetical protein